MEQKQQAPETRSGFAGTLPNTVSGDGKVTIIPSGYHQRRVFHLLSDGVPRSAADIAIALRLSDPRSTIRHLRDMGIPISDEWHNVEHGGRYKRYFIRKGGVQ